MNISTQTITRREVVKIGAGAIASAAGTAAAQREAKPSRIAEYAWGRGFSDQPSWAC